jgi:hypothetical protein
MKSDSIVSFLKSNPLLTLDIILKRGHHPYLNGHFVNGFIKDYPLRNIEGDDVVEYFERAKNSSKESIFHAISGKNSTRA